MPKVYPLEIVEKGLMLVATTGSTTIASRLLTEQGHEITKQTLHVWKTSTHIDRYAAICAEIAPKLRERMAAQAESVVDELTALEHSAAEKLKDQLANLEGKDLAGALRNISTSKGINLQHAAQLRDRPALVVEHKHSLEDLDRLIQAIDAAEPVHVDAEVEVIDDAMRGQLPRRSETEQRTHDAAAS